MSTHNKVFRNLASADYDIGDVVHGKAAMRCSNMLLASVVPHAALDAAIVSACNQHSRDASELAEYVAEAHAFTEMAAADGGGVNHREPTLGATALMAASRHGDVALVRQLLQMGANVNQCDAVGQTAAVWAAVHGHEEALGVISAAGGRFPPAEHIMPEVSQLLVRMGAKSTAVRSARGVCVCFCFCSIAAAACLPGQGKGKGQGRAKARARARAKARQLKLALQRHYQQASTPHPTRKTQRRGA